MNLLITGAWQCTEEQLNELREHGHEIVFMQHEKDSLPCEYEWVEGVICNNLFSSHPIEKFKNICYIQLTSVGFDRIPMEYIKERNIEIHNARGVYSIPMAEFALCGVLQLYKQSKFFYKNQTQHKWEKHRGLLELMGKKVVIVGCGSVGNECARRFQAFGCEVIGVDLLSFANEYYSKIYDIHELDEVLSTLDVLVLSLPLTKDTYHLINKDRLEKLKNTAIIVNISRGEIVDTNSLITHLPRIGGAVLDVFENEPLNENSALWEMENVIVTPHNSFVGDGNSERLSKIIFNEVHRYVLENKEV